MSRLPPPGTPLPNPNTSSIKIDLVPKVPYNVAMEQNFGPEVEHVPGIATHLVFLRDHDWRFNKNLTDARVAKINDNFRNYALNLPSDKQRVVSIQLNSLNEEISSSLQDENPAVSDLRQKQLGKRVLDVLEDTGFIYSVKPKGLELTRESLAEKAQEVFKYFNEFDQFAKRVHTSGTNEDYRSSAEGLMELTGGIKQELKRLGFTQEPDYKENEINLDTYDQYQNVNSHSKFSSHANTLIEHNGVMGFNRITEMLDNFSQTRRYLRIGSAWD